MNSPRRLGALLALGILASLSGCGGGGGGGSSEASRLAGVSLSSGVLAPAFAPGTSDYAVEVDCAVTSLSVTPVAVSPFASILVNDVSVPSGTPSDAMPLAVTPVVNRFLIVVTAPDGGSTSRYAVTCTRRASADLAGLEVSAGTLSPAFARGATAYRTTVGFAASTIVVTPTPVDPGATLEVNGVEVAAGAASAPIPLVVNPATNTIEVRVVASDGSSTAVHTITAVRLPDVRLAGLEFSLGDLAPSFDAGTTDYALDVGNLVAAITVTPTASHASATLRVNGVPVASGSSSGAVPLVATAAGSPIDVEVTGSDGVTAAHTTVVATRRPALKQDANVTPAAAPFGVHSVAVDGDTMVVGAFADASGATGVDGDETDVSAPYAGAACVYVREHGAWSRQAYLKASNTGAGDLFGYAVAVSGDRVVVGALEEDSASTGVDGDASSDALPGAGAAYVFVRSNGVWSQEAYLKASNTGVSAPGVGQGGAFAQSVAISGDTIVVGAPFESSDSTGVDGNPSSTAAGYSGAAYVFVRSGGVWQQQAYLKASNTRYGDEFGYAVGVSGDTVVVGAPYEASIAGGVDAAPAGYGAGSGAAYVFVRSGTAWAQQAHLKAAVPAAGDGFGTSVAVDGDTIAAGAPGQASSATGVGGDESNTAAPNAGAAHVFLRQDSTWSRQAFLKASNTGAGDAFGQVVALSGDALVVGAPGEAGAATGVGGNGSSDAASDAGAAYVFVRSGASWASPVYVKGSATNSGDALGSSVGASIDTIVVVAPGAGATYVYR